MTDESAGHIAAQALAKRINMSVEYVEHLGSTETGKLLISPTGGLSRLDFGCYILLHLRPPHLAHIQARLSQQRGNIAILITNYANPSIRAALLERGINFVDLMGNCHLQSEGYFFSHSGLKPVSTAIRKTNKAFDLAGMKLILALLSKQVAINASYRELAKSAEIALGAVGPALDGLDKAGYLMCREDSERRLLRNKKKLFDRWVETYIDRIKPKLFLGLYETTTLNCWQDWDIYNSNSRWGGEPAGALVTNYLRPEILTIYTPLQNRGKLFVAARIRMLHEDERAAGTLVELYERFGPDYIPEFDYPQDVVNPMIVYADLAGTHDSRNLETAEVIYESRIDRFVRED